MMKLLIDDLGRIVGKADVSRGDTRRVEYGFYRRDLDGLFEVVGIANVRPISSQKISHQEVEDLPTYEC